ncbi:MAG: hypothetical protein ACTSRP_19095 [Candidatus Helarchaeota archaeon]
MSDENNNEKKVENKKFRSFSIKKGGAKRATEKGKESLLKSIEEDE